RLLALAQRRHPLLRPRYVVEPRNHVGVAHAKGRPERRVRVRQPLLPGDRLPGRAMLLRAVDDHTIPIPEHRLPPARRDGHKTLLYSARHTRRLTPEIKPVTMGRLGKRTTQARARHYHNSRRAVGAMGSPTHLQCCDPPPADPVFTGDLT